MSLDNTSHPSGTGHDELVPSRYALRVGEIDVMVISDGVLSLPGAMLGHNADPAVQHNVVIFDGPDAESPTLFSGAVVTGLLAAMLSINPQLHPEQLRMLLRRSAMTIGDNHDFEQMDGEDLTAPILPSERNYQLNDKDVGRSARLDMQKALDLSVQSRDRVR